MDEFILRFVELTAIYLHSSIFTELWDFYEYMQELAQDYSLVIKPTYTYFVDRANDYILNWQGIYDISTPTTTTTPAPTLISTLPPKLAQTLVSIWEFLGEINSSINDIINSSILLIESIANFIDLVHMYLYINVFIKLFDFTEYSLEL